MGIFLSIQLPPLPCVQRYVQKIRHHHWEASCFLLDTLCPLSSPPCLGPTSHGIMHTTVLAAIHLPPNLSGSLKIQASSCPLPHFLLTKLNCHLSQAQSQSPLPRQRLACFQYGLIVLWGALPGVSALPHSLLTNWLLNFSRNPHSC